MEHNAQQAQKEKIMEHNTQSSKASTSRRSFLRKGLAVGGAGAIGAGLLANGLPAFAEERSGGLTAGSKAICGNNTTNWEASRTAKSQGAVGVQPTSRL